MTTEPRTIAIPCRAAGCPTLVGLTEGGGGAWRGACSRCGECHALAHGAAPMAPPWLAEPAIETASDGSGGRVSVLLDGVEVARVANGPDLAAAIGIVRATLARVAAVRG